MTSTVSKPEQSHKYPGWWSVTVMLNGELATTWGRSESEAYSAGQGLLQNMEAVHSRAQEKGTG